MSEAALIERLTAYYALQDDGRFVDVRTLVGNHPEYDQGTLDEIASMKKKLQQLRDTATRKRKRLDDAGSAKKVRTSEEADLVANLSEYGAMQDDGRVVDVRTLVRDHPEYDQATLETIAELKKQLQKIRDAAIRRAKPKPPSRLKVCTVCNMPHSIEKYFISPDASVCLLCQSKDP
jgi:hypothetical protein